MKFARLVFLIAGVYGVIALPPQYFLEEQLGRDYPPAVTHPEFYYGFVGVTLAWQVAFLVIASDPARYRPLMLPAVLEKAGFAVAIPVLYLNERVYPVFLGFAGIDFVLGVLFLVAYVRLRGTGYGPNNTAGR
jgi:hypothetical protein